MEQQIMTNSVLETVIQQIDNLTPDEQKFVANYLDKLAHQQNKSAIIRSRLIIIKCHREEILELASSYGASNIRIFFKLDTHKNDTSTKEVNFLVDLEQDRSLFDLGGLLMDLRELLGFEIFVFTQETIKDSYRGKILQNAITL